MFRILILSSFLLFLAAPSLALANPLDGPATKSTPVLEAPAAMPHYALTPPTFSAQSQTGSGSLGRSEHSTAKISLAQAGVHFLGSTIYWSALALFVSPTVFFGAPSEALILPALIMGIGYPFVSAALVDITGNRMGGGSYYGASLLGAFLGIGAAGLVGVLLPPFVSAPVFWTAAVFQLALVTATPIAFYHMARHRQHQRSATVGLAPVMSPPTAWGTRAMEGAGLQVGFSF